MRLTRLVLSFLVCLLLVLASPLRAADVQVQAQRLINSAGLQQVRIGLYVTDLRSGEVLLELNPDQPMAPASNMKLVTTAAAIKMLGPDFVFHTTLSLVQPPDWAAQVSVPISAGSDNASANSSDPSAQSVPGVPLLPASPGVALIIHGDGDPGFADPKLLAAHNADVEQLLQSWVAAVRSAGVSHIDQLIVDDRVFDHVWVNPNWPEEQLNHEYCAEVAGLDFYDNCLDVYTQPTGLGQNPVVRLEPAAPFLTTTNRAVTGRVDTFWISRRPDTNELIYRGEVRNRRTMPYDITVHDPPLFFGQVLAHRLALAGVSVGAITRPAPGDRLPAGRLLASVDDPLPLVLQRCNKDSQNLFAESFLKRLGRAVTGMPGSWESGAAAERIFLHEVLGNEAADLTIVDGSGLSRENRVTARAVVGILAAMDRDPKLGPVFRASLAIGGSDGSLRDRFRRDLDGQVFGKTGTITGVSSLSGYLVLPDAQGSDHTVAFSLLFNGFRPPVYIQQVRALQDRLVVLIDHYMAASTETIRQGG